MTRYIERLYLNATIAEAVGDYRGADTLVQEARDLEALVATMAEHEPHVLVVDELLTERLGFRKALLRSVA